MELSEEKKPEPKYGETDWLSQVDPATLSSEERVATLGKILGGSSSVDSTSNERAFNSRMQRVHVKSKDEYSYHENTRETELDDDLDIEGIGKISNIVDPSLLLSVVNDDFLLRVLALQAGMLTDLHDAAANDWRWIRAFRVQRQIFRNELQMTKIKDGAFLRITGTVGTKNKLSTQGFDAYGGQYPLPSQDEYMPEQQQGGQQQGQEKENIATRLMKKVGIGGNKQR